MNVHSRLQHAQALESRFASRLAAALGEQAQAVPRDIAERLRVAREQAVARAVKVRATQPAAKAAGAGIVVAVGARAAARGAPIAWWQRAASAAPLLMLVLGFMLVNHVAEVEQVQAAADIDVQLLADQLPPDAYSDPGFAEYLRTPPP